jgi:hypothetical protein
MYSRDFKKLKINPGDILGIQLSTADKRRLVFQFNDLVRVGKPYYLEGIDHDGLEIRKLRLISIESIAVLRESQNKPDQTNNENEKD